MKKIFLLLFPLTLAACGTGEALDELAKATPRSACEDFTRSLLDSPSTFRLVDVSQWEEPLTASEMEDIREMNAEIGSKTPGLIYVGVEFDAMNDMGATVRSSNLCPFPTADGKVLQSEVDALVEASEHVRALQNQGRTGRDFPVMQEPVA